MRFERYDVAVIGLGAVGSAALWRAAARGASAIGLEQYDPGHPFGSSHGGSRIFRQTLFEGPDYVPLARRAKDLWRLETESGAALFRRSGGLCIGPPDGPLIAGALESARLGAFDHELLSTTELFTRYPQHARRDAEGDVAVLEPGAGVLHPERCIAAAVARAVELGAEVAPRTAVTEIQGGDGEVHVRTADAVIVAASAILATGAWFTHLVPGLRIPVTIQRSPLVWFSGDDRPAYRPDRFPCFIRRSGELDGWGIPDVDGRGVKIGVSSAVADKPVLPVPEDNRYPIDERDTAPPELFARRAFPGLRPVAVAAEPCMNARTPDRDFILGIPNAAPRMVLAGGFSGHGFKHASACGDVAVDLALEGATEVDLTRFDPDRFTTAHG